MNDGVVTAPATRRNWPTIIYISLLHVGALLAPFTFTWSGLVVFAALYLIVGFGITLGYHRLLTHRSFRTPRVLEYFFSVLGSLANQGGPLQWGSAHRAHHAPPDRPGDPHTPNDGAWWSHMLWWAWIDPVHDDLSNRRALVKDLVKDRFYRFLDAFQLLPPLAMASALFALGEC